MYLALDQIWYDPSLSTILGLHGIFWCASKRLFKSLSFTTDICLNIMSKHKKKHVVCFQFIFLNKSTLCQKHGLMYYSLHLLTLLQHFNRPWNNNREMLKVEVGLGSWEVSNACVEVAYVLTTTLLELEWETNIHLGTCSIRTKWRNRTYKLHPCRQASLWNVGLFSGMNCTYLYNVPFFLLIWMFELEKHLLLLVVVMDSH